MAVGSLVSGPEAAAKVEDDLLEAEAGAETTGTVELGLGLGLSAILQAFVRQLDVFADCVLATAQS